MNRKLYVLLITLFSVLCIALVGIYGIAPYVENKVLASELKWESEDFNVDEELNVYYYLPYLEKNETKRIYLCDKVFLDEEASYRYDTLSYSIAYSDDINGPSLLEFVIEGPLKGWLTVNGQTSATITVSTTDGSNLNAYLLVRPTKYVPGETIGGDIFK